MQGKPMSAALRLANKRVFQRVNDAVPALIETGHARGLSAHDLRHAALVMRILELEQQTKSELTNTNLLNLIISDRFLDAPHVTENSARSVDFYSENASPSRPRALASSHRRRCEDANPLCAYAESVSVKWSIAKIGQAYRSRPLLRTLREIVGLQRLPPLPPRAFHGLPLFVASRVKRHDGDAPLRDAMQDYLIMYRRQFQASPPHPDDAWGKAALATIVANAEGLTVGKFLRDLHVKLLDDVEESRYLDEFLARRTQTPRAIAAAADALEHPYAVDLDENEEPRAAASAEVHGAATVSHVGMYALGSPSTETKALHI